jgi:hypothetical protein
LSGGVTPPAASRKSRANKLGAFDHHRTPDSPWRGPGSDIYSSGFATIREKQKAGWDKTIFVSPLPSIDSTMQVINIKTGEVAYSISSTKANARRGRKGSAEHLAKNLAQKMQDDGEMFKD